MMIRLGSRQNLNPWFRVNECVFVCVCVCVCVCVRACVWVLRVRVRVLVCVLVRMRVPARVRVHWRMCVCLCARVSVPVCMRAYMCALCFFFLRALSLFLRVILSLFFFLFFLSLFDSSSFAFIKVLSRLLLFTVSRLAWSLFPLSQRNEDKCSFHGMFIYTSINRYMIQKIQTLFMCTVSLVAWVDYRAENISK